MSRLYLDMDGVLADFDGECASQGVYINRDGNRLFKQNVNKSDWTEEEKDHEARVHALMEKPGFFRNLRLMPGARDLWSLVQYPYVLTARPKVEDKYSRVYKEKLEWINEYFGNIPSYRYICCLRSEKAEYATHHDGPLMRTTKVCNILIDDLSWNCTEWEKAGGRAILFRSAEQAVKEFNKLNDRVDVV